MLPTRLEPKDVTREQDYFGTTVDLADGYLAVSSLNDDNAAGGRGSGA
jgi:hypothetical protein